MNQLTGTRLDSTVRIGAVSYLNTKPLIDTLDRGLGPNDRLSLDLPSRLAAQLAKGDIDVGLIPAIEFFRGPDPSSILENPKDEYQIISNACIACRGIVRSVRLFFRVPPNRVTTIAIDEGSRTSVALATILMHHRFGTRPAQLPFPMAADPHSVAGDAVLVIGDRAMNPERFTGFIENWDLGFEWFRETGLPFVFAMWVGRRSMASRRLAFQLESARDQGVRSIEGLSEKYASQYALSKAECMEYLSKNLRFTMHRDEIQGLKTFQQMAIQLGLAPAAPLLKEFTLMPDLSSPLLIAGPQ